MISLFVHADALHLIGNLVGLLMFGPRVVRTLGWLPVLLLAGIAGELANRAATALIDRPVVGASAAVFALAGAWWVLFPHDRASRVSVALLIVVQVVFAAAALDFGGVAWCAHLIGAAMGAVFALAARPVRNRKAIASPS